MAGLGQMYMTLTKKMFPYFRDCKSITFQIDKIALEVSNNHLPLVCVQRSNMSQLSATSLYT